MRFDAMHAVTGPYAEAIFERRARRAGGHRRQRRRRWRISAAAIPIPNPVNAADLMTTMFGDRRARLRRGVATATATAT